MANNPDLFNAAFLGAAGGAQKRWNIDPTAANYTAFRNAVQLFALAVDDAIAPIADVNISQVGLMQSLCQGALTDRYPTSQVQADYEILADAIAAMFNLLSGVLESSIPVAFTSLSRVSYVDPNTTVDQVNDADGSINFPYNNVQPAANDLNSFGGSIMFVPGSILSQSLDLTTATPANSYSLIGLTNAYGFFAPGNVVQGPAAITANVVNVTLHLKNLQFGPPEGTGIDSIGNVTITDSTAGALNICNNLLASGVRPVSENGFDAQLPCTLIQALDVQSNVNGHGFISNQINCATLNADSAIVQGNLATTRLEQLNGFSECTNMSFSVQTVNSLVAHTLTMDQWSNPNVAVSGVLVKVVV